MNKIIGIDLGTTNSCFAQMLGGKGEVITNSNGGRTTPSIVYIKGNEILIGELAKRKMIMEPKNVIFEVKRFIGMKYDDVKKELDEMPYETKKGKDGGVLIVVDGKEYKPEQISSLILKEIKRDAEKFIGGPVNNAVITVPAYFNDSQRNATKIAGEIAGFKVERIINEPTAASLAYGNDQKKDKQILVFDLGGGTFDVTVLEIGTEGTFQVLSTSGDTHLGGKDFDRLIINYITENFKIKEGIDLKDNPMAIQRVREEAEKVKIQLSQTESASISIPFIIQQDGNPKNLEDNLTRATFEQISKNLIQKCSIPLQNAIKDAKIEKSDIDEVVLVGGSTRMPWVKDLIKKEIGKEAKSTLNPDEAVAIGAAVQGGIIKGDVTDILLMDVTPLSLSVEVEGGLSDVIIQRNATIPAKKSKIYSTATDNQPAVTVHVLQGERQFAKDNKSLGQFNLEGIPPMGRGQPQIEVTFDIDVNGLLSVSAKEKTTGKEQKVTIQGATGISDEEIAKAKADAENFAEEDKKKKEIIEEKNKIESGIYTLEKILKDGDKIFNNNKKSEIKNKIDLTKQLLNNNLDINELKNENEQLMKYINDLNLEIQKQSQTQSQQNPFDKESQKNGKSQKGNGEIEGEVIES